MRIKIKSVKAQISVFVILAVVIVVAGGFAYYTISSKKGESSDDFFSKISSDSNLNSLRDRILECREQASEDSIKIIGVQGGFFEKPEKALSSGTSFIPYYYYEGELLMPSKQKIEIELGKAVDNYFVSCLKKIKVEDLKLTYKKSKTRAIIGKEDVLFTIDMPFTITKGGSAVRVEMKDAPISMPSKLYSIIEIAEYITDSHKEDDKMICVTCVSQMAQEREVYVNSLGVKDFSSLVLISENSTSSEPYFFEFLNKYPASEGVKINIPELPEPPRGDM